MVNLGDRVEDVVSGFKGIVVSRHEYLNGCTRLTVQPQVDGEGKLPGSETFDEPQLRVLGKIGYERKGPVGGPERYADRGRGTDSRDD